MGNIVEGRAVSDPFEAGEIRQFAVGKAHIDKMTIAGIVDLSSEEGPYAVELKKEVRVFIKDIKCDR
jgi:hypothetical protein